MTNILSSQINSTQIFNIDDIDNKPSIDSAKHIYYSHISDIHKLAKCEHPKYMYSDCDDNTKINQAQSFNFIDTNTGSEYSNNINLQSDAANNCLNKTNTCCPYSNDFDNMTRVVDADIRIDLTSCNAANYTDLNKIHDDAAKIVESTSNCNAADQYGSAKIIDSTSNCNAANQYGSAKIVDSTSNSNAADQYKSYCKLNTTAFLGEASFKKQKDICEFDALDASISKNTLNLLDDLYEEFIKINN